MSILYMYTVYSNWLVIDCLQLAANKHYTKGKSPNQTTKLVMQLHHMTVYFAVALLVALLLRLMFEVGASIMCEVQVYSFMV